jgi:hypothetical protein
MKLKKLNRELYQDVITRFGCKTLKLRNFQNGTFGTGVTTRPICIFWSMERDSMAGCRTVTFTSSAFPVRPVKCG